MRKLWNPRNFKAHVSPHEMLQAVVLCSKKNFQITKQGKGQSFLIFRDCKTHGMRYADVRCFVLHRGRCGLHDVVLKRSARSSGRDKEKVLWVDLCVCTPGQLEISWLYLVRLRQSQIQISASGLEHCVICLGFIYRWWCSQCNWLLEWYHLVFILVPPQPSSQKHFKAQWGSSPRNYHTQIW